MVQTGRTLSLARGSSFAMSNTTKSTDTSLLLYKTELAVYLKEWPFLSVYI